MGGGEQVGKGGTGGGRWEVVSKWERGAQEVSKWEQRGTGGEQVGTEGQRR